MAVFDPEIDKYLISDQGEIVIDEVRKHWSAMVSAILEAVGGFVILAFVFAVPSQWAWVPAIPGMVVVLHASWRMLAQQMDRFVITNMRVFRVHGILAQRLAIMPLARILDISVYKPFLGRIFGYGHFVFESAAQAQGLREIRYVGRPDERGLTIQRVIQQAGLRGSIGRGADVAPAIVPTPQAQTQPLPPRPPVPPPGREEAATGWEWLAAAQRRETERLAQLRGESAGPAPSYDPDRTTTAPIDLQR